MPPDALTLSNILAFTSSLSTVVMVIIVIATNSLQRKEMAMTRILQNQPFPLILPSDSSYIEPLKMWFDVPKNTVSINSRIFFSFSIENIGNGPAIGVDIFAGLSYVDQKGEVVKLDPINESIGSMKQNEKRTEEIMFKPQTISQPTMAECILKNHLSTGIPCIERETLRPSFLTLTVFYKNILGATFKEKAHFVIRFNEDDSERIKSCLKLLQTARIDYGKDLSKISSIMKNTPLEAVEIVSRINEEISKKKGCTKIDFEADPINEIFSIRSISEKEYKKTREKALFKDNHRT